MRRVMALLCLCVLLATASAQAQVCVDELWQVVRPSAAGPVRGSLSPGQAAALLLERMVRLAEPALPASRDGSGPLEGAGPAAAAITYLHQRHLLPANWSVDGHGASAWNAMLRGLARWYGVDPPAAAATELPAMVEEAAATLALISEALRPLPVFATGDGGGISFFAVIWNWTRYPRLLLFPPDGLRLGQGNSRAAATPVLEAVGNCALRFDDFVFADEEVAMRMFIEQGRSTLRLLATDVDPAATPLRTVEEDEVVRMLRFDHPYLAGAHAASVAIDGPSPSVTTILLILPRLRTSLSPFGLQWYLAFP